MVSGGGGGGGTIPQETRGRLASPPEAKAFSLAQPHAQASDTASRPRSPVPGRRRTPRHRRGPAVCPSMPRTAWPFPLGLCQASVNLCFQEAVTVALRLGPCVALAASAQVSAGAPLSGVTCLPISGWQFAWLLQFSGGPRKVTGFPWVWPFFLEGQGWCHVAGGSPVAPHAVRPAPGDRETRRCLPRAPAAAIHRTHRRGLCQSRPGARGLRRGERDVFPPAGALTRHAPRRSSLHVRATRHLGEQSGGELCKIKRSPITGTTRDPTLCPGGLQGPPKPPWLPLREALRLPGPLAAPADTPGPPAFVSCVGSPRAPAARGRRTWGWGSAQDACRTQREGLSGPPSVACPRGDEPANRGGPFCTRSAGLRAICTITVPGRARCPDVPTPQSPVPPRQRASADGLG